jgi:hypothetical protein
VRLKLSLSCSLVNSLSPLENEEFLRPLSEAD